MRNGIQIWVDQDRAERLRNNLHILTSSKFISFEDKTLNSADITGVFSPKDMEDFNHIKKGDWKCKYNNWHEKNEICKCGMKATFVPPKVKKASRESVEKVRNIISGFDKKK